VRSKCRSVVTTTFIVPSFIGVLQGEVPNLSGPSRGGALARGACPYRGADTTISARMPGSFALDSMKHVRTKPDDKRGYKSPFNSIKQEIVRVTLQH
jgi:hypothetical protein